MPVGSPLLDAYDQTGIVKPALKHALDMTSQRLFPPLGTPMVGQPAGAPPPQAEQGEAAPPQPSPVRPPGAGAVPPAAPQSPAAQNLARLTAPPQTGDLAHTKADTGQSGINQIHNPWVRHPLQILDAIGSAFLPSLTMGLPGTALHHQILTGQAAQNVGRENEQATGEAQRNKLLADTNRENANQPIEAKYKTALTNEADARAKSMLDPQPKSKPIGSTTIVDGKVKQFNPETDRYDIEVGSAEKPGHEGLVNDKEGNVIGWVDGSGKHHSLDEAETPPAIKKIADTATAKVHQGKEPGREDKYIAILQKPEKERTPEEHSYVTAYKQWMKENKIDPGTMRMQVLTEGRPVQVLDENDPSKVTWDRAGHAIQKGSATPSSIPFSADKAVTKAFTSGKPATDLTAINTAHAHISQLEQIANALHNGDITVANRLSNEYKRQTGEAAPSSFALLQGAVTSEIAKTTHGGVSTDAESKKFNDAIRAAGSPKELHAVLGEARKLMESKREMLKQQFEQGKEGKPNFGGGSKAEEWVRDASGKLVKK